MTCSMLGSTIKKTGILVLMISLALLGVSYADEAAEPTESTGGKTPALAQDSPMQTEQDPSYDPWTEAESILLTDKSRSSSSLEVALDDLSQGKVSAEVKDSAPGESSVLAGSSGQEAGAELPLSAQEKSDPLELAEMKVTSTANESLPPSSLDVEPEVRRPLALPESEDVERLSATTLTGVKTLAMEQGVLVYLEADGLLGDASYFAIENPDRLVIDLVGIKNEVAETRFSIPSEQVRRIRLGTHPDKIRVVLDGGPKPVDFENPRVVSSQAGLYMSLGTGEDLQGAFSQILMGQAPDLVWNEAVLVANKEEEPKLNPSVKVDATLPNAEPPTLPASPELPRDVVAKRPTLPLSTAPAPVVAVPTAVIPAAAVPAAPAQTVALNEAPEVKNPVQQEMAEVLPVVEPLSVPDSAVQKVGFVARKDTQGGAAVAPGKAASAEVFGLQFERNESRDRVAILLDALVDYSVFEPDAETIMLQIPNARFAGDTGERITPESGGPVSLGDDF